MARVRLIWQLFPAFILILLASLLAVTWTVTGLVAEFHEQEARSSLEDRLSLMRLPLGEALRQGGAALADARCKALARQAFTRFTLIGRDGAVLADSAELPAAMENHGHRPEVRTAMAGGIGYARRQSATLRRSPPDNVVTSRSPSGRRSASIAWSRCCSSCHASARSMASCTVACSASSVS